MKFDEKKVSCLRKQDDIGKGHPQTTDICGSTPNPPHPQVHLNITVNLVEQPISVGSLTQFNN